MVNQDTKDKLEAVSSSKATVDSKKEATLTEVENRDKKHKESSLEMEREMSSIGVTILYYEGVRFGTEDQEDIGWKER